MIITRADRLLLLLARGRLTRDADSQVLELLEQDISWPSLLEQARTQEVFPLVYHNLRALNFPNVPEEARAELADRYRRNAVRNAVLGRELAAVLRLFDQSGIPVIPLKGPALAQSLYGDSTLRVCRDLDILVPRPFVTDALQRLSERGYNGRCKQPLIAGLILRYGTEHTVVREEHQFTYLIDLHWGMFVGTAREHDALAELWREAQPKEYFGVQASSLTPEWELLFLATHAARHQWQGLRWLVDIHEVCSHTAIDWEKLKSMAARLEWDKILEITLAASHDLCGTPIPPQFGSSRVPSWLQLFPAEPRCEGPGTAFMLRLLARPSQRLGYLAVVLLIPTAEDAKLLPLPSPLGFFYYPFRPLRLLGKWRWQVVRIMFRCVSALFPAAGGRNRRARANAVPLT